MRFELTTPTLARLCSTTELCPRSSVRRAGPKFEGRLIAERPFLCKRAVALRQAAGSRRGATLFRPCLHA
jgi:hypothetical protein